MVYLTNVRVPLAMAAVLSGTTKQVCIGQFAINNGNIIDVNQLNVIFAVIFVYSY